MGLYALLVFLSGCSYGVLSTIVKTAYAAGFQVADVSGSQAFFWYVPFVDHSVEIQTDLYFLSPRHAFCACRIAYRIDICLLLSFLGNLKCFVGHCLSLSICMDWISGRNTCFSEETDKTKNDFHCCFAYMISLSIRI